ncbi:MAG: matrixin family metalloprotease, partial [Mycobacteriaceae bacterium]
SISLSIGDGPRVYVTGQIELDVEKFTRTLAEPGGANENRAVIEHELGHLVGLHHVADPTQLMYATNTGGVTNYAEGDLTGLAALGRGPCEPHL